MTPNDGRGPQRQQATCHPVQQRANSPRRVHKAGMGPRFDGRSSRRPIPSERGPCECTRVANLSASSDQDPYGKPLPGWHVEIQDGLLGLLACCPLLEMGGFTVATHFLAQVGMDVRCFLPVPSTGEQEPETLGIDSGKLGVNPLS